MPMKPILDTVLFVIWVSAYLTAVACAARYRRARVHSFSDPVQGEYRADKDVGLRLAMLVVGALLGWLVYLAATTITHLLS